MSPATLAALISVHAPVDLAVDLPDDPVAVYGGEDSGSCDWPTTVFLGGCSGTLIHPEIVMYASHCGDAIPTVYFGEDFTSGEPIEGHGFSVATEYCVVNPEAENTFGLAEFRAADFAFCKLAEPVENVPIVPPLVGCERTVLVPGAAVTLVGFGLDEDDVFAVKHQVTTVLDYIDDLGVAVIGGHGQSSCNGDSGGPAYVQLPDGSWRVFGIVSGPNVGNCGDPGWYPTSFLALPFIEQTSGIDVTPCHYATGEWNPGPSCGQMPIAPDDGAGKAWNDGCAGGPTLAVGSACGPAFDASEDLVAPDVAIDTPEDRSRFDTEPDADGVPLTVTAHGDDAISGLRQMALVVNGDLVEGGLRIDPPWKWNITVPHGVWDLQVEATDWAGNAARSRSVVVGVDEDPPPAPEPSTSSGGDGSGSTGALADGTSTTGVGTSTGDGSGGSTGASAQLDDDGSCGCRTQGARTPWLLVGAIALVRRRRRTIAVDGTPARATIR